MENLPIEKYQGKTFIYIFSIGLPTKDETLGLPTKDETLGLPTKDETLGLPTKD